MGADKVFLCKSISSCPLACTFNHLHSQVKEMVKKAVKAHLMLCNWKIYTYRQKIKTAMVVCNKTYRLPNQVSGDKFGCLVA